MKIEEIEIDDRIKEILISKGINELYPPQAEAIPYVLSSKNVVLAMPTASGKTLVAYIALLVSALKNGKGLYIVPLKALASEKYSELKEFEKLGIKVGIATGDYDSPSKYLENYDIIISTTEKADSLMRHNTSLLEKFNVLIIDEIHLLNDFMRGPTLEVFISRFREMNPKAQLIALSATITNSDDISSWLNAEHIKSLWRPVKLREGVYYKDGIYFSDGDEKNIKKIFRDDIANLVLETVFEGGQALIFVNARKYAEALAEKLGEVLKKFLSNETPVHYESDIAIEDVGEETDIGKKLKRCLKNGVAFHHAGLTQQQRDKIEKQFKERILKCIVATPTLAAGINLPARRVIVRDLRRYENGCSLYIPVLEVKQMCGRAGRPKYDKEGEAIIIGKRKEEVQWLIEKYFKSEGEIIISKLCNENILRMHILGAVASGYTSTFNILKKFIGSTFYAYTEKRGIDSEIINVISFLNKNGFIEVFGDELLPTVFGKRVAQLYIDPSSGIVLRDALENTKNATSFSYLHAISATQDMHKLRLYLRKGDYEWLNEEVEKRREEFILPIPDNGYEWFLSEVKNALLLEDWIQERKDGWLANKYDVGPGDIRARVESSEWLLYAALEIGKVMKKKKEVLNNISRLILRVRDGVKEELLELVQLKGIGRVRARALFKAGFRNITDLRKADINELKKISAIGEAVAKQIKKQVEGEGLQS